MPLNRECPAFDNFGIDVKEARQALKLSRSAFAEKIGDRKSTRLNSSH